MSSSGRNVNIVHASDCCFSCDSCDVVSSTDELLTGEGEERIELGREAFAKLVGEKLGDLGSETHFGKSPKSIIVKVSCDGTDKESCSLKTGEYTADDRTDDVPDSGSVSDCFHGGPW